MNGAQSPGILKNGHRSTSGPASGANRLEDRLPKGPDTEAVALVAHLATRVHTRLRSYGEHTRNYRTHTCLFIPVNTHESIVHTRVYLYGEHTQIYGIHTCLFLQ